MFKGTVLNQSQGLDQMLININRTKIKNMFKIGNISRIKMIGMKKTLFALVAIYFEEKCLK